MMRIIPRPARNPRKRYHTGSTPTQSSWVRPVENMPYPTQNISSG